VDETSELPEPTVDQLPDREDSSPQETILQLAQKPNEQFTEETQTTVIKITKKKSKKTVPEITEIMGQTNEVPEQSVEQLTFQEDSPPQESTLQPAQKPDEQFTEEANVTLTKLIRINSKKTAPKVTEIANETSEVPEPSDDHLPDREDSSPQETDMELVQKPDDYFIEKSQVKLTNLVRKKSKKIAPGVTKIVDETSKVPEITVEQLAIQEDSSSQNTNVQSIENPDEQFTEEAKVTVTKLSKKKPKKPATEVTDIMEN